MRISDWRSDVCASDLAGLPLAFRRDLPAGARWTLAMVAAACGLHMVALVGSDGIWGGVRHAMPVMVAAAIVAGGALAWAWRHQIGRASWRERVCQYV